MSSLKNRRSSNSSRKNSLKKSTLPPEMHMHIAKHFTDVKDIIKARSDPELKDYIIPDIVYLLNNLVKNKKFEANNMVMHAQLSKLLSSKILSKLNSQQVYNIMVFFQMLKHTGTEKMQFTDSELITMSEFKNITIAEELIKLFTPYLSNHYQSEYFFVKHFIIFMIHNPELYKTLLTIKDVNDRLHRLCDNCTRRFNSELRFDGENSDSIEFRNDSNEVVFVETTTDAKYRFKKENTSDNVEKLNKEFLEEYTEGGRNIVGLKDFLRGTMTSDTVKLLYKSDDVNSFNKFIKNCLIAIKPRKSRKVKTKKSFFKPGNESSSVSSSSETL